MTRCLHHFLADAELSPMYIQCLALEGNYVTPAVRATLCRVFFLTGPQAANVVVDHQVAMDLSNRIGFSSQELLKAVCADTGRSTSGLAAYADGSQMEPATSLWIKALHMLARFQLALKGMSNERVAEYFANRKPAFAWKQHARDTDSKPFPRSEYHSEAWYSQADSSEKENDNNDYQNASSLESSNSVSTVRRIVTPVPPEQ